LYVFIENICSGLYDFIGGINMPRKLSPEDQWWCIDEKTKKPLTFKGLKDICLDTTEICYIDAHNSKLYYMGYDIETLAAKSCFEETAFLLLYGRLPTAKELDAFKSRLKAERNIPDDLVELLRKLPDDVEPIEMLRTAVSYLGNLDPERSDLSREGIYSKAVRLMAKVPTIISYFYRIKNNLPIVKPNNELDHAANFLYMFHGKEAPKLWVESMDLSFILYAEHGMNASAFATVVVASTLSDYYSSIVGGIAAIRGVLHGYANVAAMMQFREIGSVDNVEKWFKENIESKRKRLIGFGHRVYRSYDPRARIFKRYAARFAEENEEIKRYYNIAIKLEDIALRSKLAEKGIYTNCDYWSCQVYRGMGFPVNYYTALFAMARIVGWTAHILEYTENNILIRPRLYYTGELDKEYIDIEKRSYREAEIKL
jgi:citrate synthase